MHHDKGQEMDLVLFYVFFYLSGNEYVLYCIFLMSLNPNQQTFNGRLSLDRGV